MAPVSFCYSRTIAWAGSTKIGNLTNFGRHLTSTQFKRYKANSVNFQYISYATGAVGSTSQNAVTLIIIVAVMNPLFLVQCSIECLRKIFFVGNEQLRR